MNNNTRQLDPDQRHALGLFNEGRNVFLTGAAGTGKSSVTVEAIRRRIDDRTLKVTATTGVAALNLRDKLAAEFGRHVDATTVYRWSGIGLGPKPDQPFEDHLRWMRSRGRAWDGTVARIRGTRTLILDEVSMLPGTTLEFIDAVCREVRCDPRPFGGIQVLAVGDFLQLPPVAPDGKYDWAFLSPSWEEAEFLPVNLRTVHRQDEPVFVGILNQFREGVITKESTAVLRKRIALFPAAKVLRLFTHNTQVDKWNNYRLECIDSPEHVYQAQTDGYSDEVDFLKRNLVTPDTLRLRVGARVMVTANLPDGCGGLMAANGEIGTVSGMNPAYVRVRLDNGRDIDVDAHEWEFDPVRQDPSGGVFRQIPLRPAWACTIHKSQGLTLDSALVDIRAAREPGQAYVAISRVRTLAGLWLKDWFAGMFIANEAVAFHRRIAEQRVTAGAPVLSLE